MGNKNIFDYSRFTYGKKIKSSQAIDAIIALRGHKCEVCGLTEWRNIPIPLEVHHIDGNKENDSATNLIVLSKEEHHRIHDGFIVQYDLDGNRIAEYANSFEAAIAIGKPEKDASIRMCLCGKSKTSCGYKWKREH